MGYNDLFIRACRRQPVERVPVWFMRQAGRTDPDYLKIKEKYSLLEICRQPELAAEVTMMPVKKLGVDAAILYSDIMNPVASIGVDFDIVPNVGPVIDQPIRTRADVDRLQPINVDRDLSHVIETIRILDRELKIPLITFAGAPFTLASYLIEGRPSRNYLKTKEMMYSDPETWHALMAKLGDMVSTYLISQLENGAKAIQLFDSWAGALSAKDYCQYVLPTVKSIFSKLRSYDEPKIYFPGVCSGELLPHLRELDVDVIGIDWRVTISEARKRFGPSFAVQGNLDPTVLMGPIDVIERAAAEIIDEGIQQNGFIFNLGHGLFPEASLDKIKHLTSFVQNYSREALKSRVQLDVGREGGNESS